MAMTVSRFRLELPEFADPNIPDAYIQAYLDEAASELEAEIWEGKLDAGIKYKAAHKMALSPQGMAAKLVDSKGESVYNVHYERLAKTVASGFRVAWPL